MRIAVISGSMRAESQSLKVSNWLSSHLTDSLESTADLLDLHELALPMFTLEQENGASVGRVLSTLEQCDAAIFVSPEWNGMMSHGLVNMQHYLGKELANKPVMLVGVSAGRGGSYPVMQMRTMGYKNNHYVISSENLVLQGINEILNNHDMADQKDVEIKKRADYALRVLIEYAKALAQVRQSGVLDYEAFGSGL